jgi:hydroxymethylpyrimidine pyrophosphatase-like HAD family hydrolase
MIQEPRTPTMSTEHDESSASTAAATADPYPPPRQSEKLDDEMKNEVERKPSPPPPPPVPTQQQVIENQRHECDFASGVVQQGPRSSPPPLLLQRRHQCNFYRMIALDLDGTLLQSSNKHNNKTISQKTVDYLRKLHSQGILLCYATGRICQSTHPHIRRLNLPGPFPVICTNGAQVVLCHYYSSSSSCSNNNYDSNPHRHRLQDDEIHCTTWKDEVLFANPLSLHVTQKAISLANQLNCMVMLCYYGHELFASAAQHQHSSQSPPPYHPPPNDWTTLLNLHRQNINSEKHVTWVGDNFHQTLQDHGLPCRMRILCLERTVQQLMTAFGVLQEWNGPTSDSGGDDDGSSNNSGDNYNDNPNNEKETMNHVCILPRPTTTTSTPTTTTTYNTGYGCIELLFNPTATKGEALKQLCQYLKIPVEQCIALGDADNDVDLLQVAGLGISMKNGTAACKEAADIISNYTNNQEGVLLELQALENSNQFQTPASEPQGSITTF